MNAIYMQFLIYHIEATSLKKLIITWLKHAPYLQDLKLIQ